MPSRAARRPWEAASRDLYRGARISRPRASQSPHRPLLSRPANTGARRLSRAARTSPGTFRLGLGTRSPPRISAVPALSTLTLLLVWVEVVEDEVRVEDSVRVVVWDSRCSWE